MLPAHKFHVAGVFPGVFPTRTVLADLKQAKHLQNYVATVRALLDRLPFTQEIAGSTPAGGTNGCSW
jgi:hypothetical protein